MNTIVFEWFISLDCLENNCYHMIAIAMLRPTFTRSLYTEDDVFLNLNKTKTLTCITQSNQLLINGIHVYSSLVHRYTSC